MALIADSAVALARVDYSETSQIIALLTREHGKIRAIAKGIKRGTKTKFAVGIDLLDIGRVVLRAKQDRGDALATLTEWKQTETVWGLRSSLPRIFAGQYAAEITANLTEDRDPHADLFDALIATLHELAATDHPLTPTTHYQRQLLTAIGSLPRFNNCVMCGRPDELTHFSSFEGGVVCGSCLPRVTEKHPVTAVTRRALCGETELSSLHGVFGLLNYHISHLMGREPRLAAKLVPRKQRRSTE